MTQMDVEMGENAAADGWLEERLLLIEASNSRRAEKEIPCHVRS